MFRTQGHGECREVGAGWRESGTPRTVLQERVTVYKGNYWCGRWGAPGDSDHGQGRGGDVGGQIRSSEESAGPVGDTDREGSLTGQTQSHLHRG